MAPLFDTRLRCHRDMIAADTATDTSEWHDMSHQRRHGGRLNVSISQSETRVQISNGAHDVVHYAMCAFCFPAVYQNIPAGCHMLTKKSVVMSFTVQLDQLQLYEPPAAAVAASLPLLCHVIICYKWPELNKQTFFIHLAVDGSNGGACFKRVSKS